MTIYKKNSFGTINITNEALATLIGRITSEVYGVVGMASRNILIDGIVELLKHDNYAKGIVVNSLDDIINIDVYIIVGFGIKVSEVVLQLQKRIQLEVKNTLQIDVRQINIFIQGIRVID